MTMEARIERLERRCRVLVACTVGITGVAGIALFSGAAQVKEPENLRVKSLQVVDSEGNVRIVLGSVESPLKEGLYGLFLKDSSGEIRCDLLDQAQLHLRKEDGAIALSAGGKSAHLQLSGPGGRPRAMMAASEDHCDIQLRDTNGELVWRASTPSLIVPRDGSKEADPFAR